LTDGAPSGQACRPIERDPCSGEGPPGNRRPMRIRATALPVLESEIGVTKERFRKRCCGSAAGA